MNFIFSFIILDTNSRTHHFLSQILENQETLNRTLIIREKLKHPKISWRQINIIYLLRNITHRSKSNATTHRLIGHLMSAPISVKKLSIIISLTASHICSKIQLLLKIAGCLFIVFGEGDKSRHISKKSLIENPFKQQRST